MTDRELEKKIKRAFSNMTPDLQDSVLSRSEEQKGKVIIMAEKRKNKWTKWVASAAAVLVVAGGIWGFAETKATDAIISLDVNPSIEIEVNRRERVVEVEPLNAEGRAVLGSMKLEGSDLEVAVNALIGSMVQNGYLDEIKNSILVSVDGKDEVRSAELERRLASKINETLKGRGLDGAVLSQTVADDDDLSDLALQYGISRGKAQLVAEIVKQNSQHTFDELADLSVHELNLISEAGKTDLEPVHSEGAPSDKEYIGREKALEAALAHAGLSQSQVRETEAELDWEKGRMVYEVEFKASGTEYDYEIDAKTGEVVRFESERDD